jgi:hypothetical protein
VTVGAQVGNGANARCSIFQPLVELDTELLAGPVKSVKTGAWTRAVLNRSRALSRCPIPCDARTPIAGSSAFDHPARLCAKEVTMSETNWVNATRRSAELSVGVAAGAILALMAAATGIGSASAQQKEKIPDFSLDSKSAWLMISDNLLPPDSGPGPVTFDKRYPYVDNREARRTNSQPTYRVADLTNPILKPWVVEQLRKANDWVLAGKVPFRARERCYPSGVPSWVVYTLVQPIHILQTPTHVTMINEGGPEVRRIWLNVPHAVNPEPTWYGDSVGHYEGGDTLVVDTIGLTNKTFVDPYLTPHTEQLHVTVRYRACFSGCDRAHHEGLEA